MPEHPLNTDQRFQLTEELLRTLLRQIEQNTRVQTQLAATVQHMRELMTRHETLVEAHDRYLFRDGNGDRECVQSWLRSLEREQTALAGKVSGMGDKDKTARDWWMKVLGDVVKVAILLAIGAIAGYYGVKLPVK